VVEANEAVPWTKPDELPYEPGKPLPKLGWSSPNGFHAAFADCKVKFLPVHLGERTLRALITPAGGERIEPKELEGAEP
jgi:hypothetical protein